MSNLKINGDLNVTGGGEFSTVKATSAGFTSTTEVSATTSTTPPLYVGTLSGAHLEFDPNEIQAKASATTSASLYLNPSGTTYVGSYLYSGGYFVPRVIIANYGSGYSVGSTTVYYWYRITQIAPSLYLAECGGRTTATFSFSDNTSYYLYTPIYLGTYSDVEVTASGFTDCAYLNARYASSSSSSGYNKILLNAQRYSNSASSLYITFHGTGILTALYSTVYVGGISSSSTTVTTG